MAEMICQTICRKVWEHRARQEEPAEKDPVEELLSSSRSDPVTFSSSSSKREYKGTTTPSRPDDNPDLSPAPARRPVTRSTPKKPTSRPKWKACKSKATKPGSGSQKQSRGHD